MQVSLCRERTNRVKVHVWADVEGENLTISGRDFGNACIEQWGKEVYEYSYRFDQNNTRKLYDVLSSGTDESSLLTLLVKNFNGIKGCVKLLDFCKTNNIQYSLSSW